MKTITMDYELYQFELMQAKLAALFAVHAFPTELRGAAIDVALRQIEGEKRAVLERVPAALKSQFKWEVAPDKIVIEK